MFLVYDIQIFVNAILDMLKRITRILKKKLVLNIERRQVSKSHMLKKNALLLIYLKTPNVQVTEILFMHRLLIVINM